MDEPACARVYSEVIAEIRKIVMEQLKKDPVGAYVSAVRTRREKKAQMEIYKDQNEKKCMEKFIAVLDEIITQLAKTEVIKLSKTFIPEIDRVNLEYFNFAEINIIKLPRERKALNEG